MQINKDRLPGARRLRILESQEKAQKAEQEARESLANYQQMTKNYAPSGPMIPGDVIATSVKHEYALVYCDKPVGATFVFNVAGVTIHRRDIGSAYEYSFYVGDLLCKMQVVPKSCG